MAGHHVSERNTLEKSIKLVRKGFTKGPALDGNGRSGLNPTLSDTSKVSPGSMAGTWGENITGMMTQTPTSHKEGIS